MSLDSVSTVCLPSELNDRILDFLHDDRRALCNCSLACRDWLPTSRHHLFHTLAAIPIQDAAPLAQLLEEDPPLGSYIEHLELGRPDNLRKGDLLAKAPLLHRGILEPRRMPNLRKLTLCEVAVDSFTVFFRLLFSQPRLEELSIRLTLYCEDYQILRSANNRSAPEWEPVPMDGVAPSALRSLEIFVILQHFPHSFFPAALLAIRDHLDLKKLVLDIPSVGFPQWSPAVKVFAGTLLSLQMSIYGADEGQIIPTL